MVWLGGPQGRGGGRTKPLMLHDPPPGYKPPKKDSWYLMVSEGHARVIMRVAVVILALAAFAVVLMITAMIAGLR